MKTLRIETGGETIDIELEEPERVVKRMTVGCVAAAITCSDRAGGRDGFVERNMFHNIYGRERLATAAYSRFMRDMADCGPEVLVFMRSRLLRTIRRT